jgi:hypothetical protein
MKRILGAKRKKSPEPSQQLNSSARPADIPAGSMSHIREELDATPDGKQITFRHSPNVKQPDKYIPPDEGGEVDPQISFWGGIDADPELLGLTSGTWTPTATVGGANYGNEPTSKCL